MSQSLERAMIFSISLLAGAAGACSQGGRGKVVKRDEGMTLGSSLVSFLPSGIGQPPWQAPLLEVDAAQVRLNGRKVVELAEIPAGERTVIPKLMTALEKLKDLRRGGSKRPPPRLVLAASGKVSFGVVARVLETASAAGFSAYQILMRGEAAFVPVLSGMAMSFPRFFTSSVSSEGSRSWRGPCRETVREVVGDPGALGLSSCRKSRRCWIVGKATRTRETSRAPRAKR